MIFEERKRKIINLVDQLGAVSYNELVEKCGVSESTIRRDLANLEKDQLLIRFRGGARKVNGIMDNSMNIKQTIHMEEKRYIGKVASTYIKPNEMIFIGSGSTTLAFIENLQDTSISVITNGIPHIEALHKKDINCFLLCGFLKNNTQALLGNETIELLKTFHFDQAFIGTNGIGKNLEILSVGGYEHEIKTLAIKNSKKAHVLADHTKFNKSGMYSIPISNIEGIDIITDSVSEELNDYPFLVKTK